MRRMQSPQIATIAFIGGGNMARALIAGLLRRTVAPAQIHVGEPQPQARAALAREWGVKSSPDNATAARDASLLVLAVKPQQAGQALRALYPTLLERKPVVLSIAAGLRLADLARACPPGYRRGARDAQSAGAARRRRHRPVRTSRGHGSTT
jgi:pyrroline-5-carboxylate reductase